MPNCIAIVLSTGRVCGKMCRGGNRCVVHTNSLRKFGPHNTERKELKAVYDGRIRELFAQDRGLNETEDAADALYAQYRLDVIAMSRRHAEFVAAHGDPDAPAAEVRRERNQQLANARRARMMARAIPPVDPFLDGMDALRVDRVVDVNNNVRDFAADSQNVHTTVAVTQTQEIIQKILSTIPVPEEYRWDADVCSKTPGEIISECKLKQAAAFQMMSKYTSSETIYEMESGVYGKTLDAIWQFVKNSDDKTCLVRILKTELEDNIGMCAQGNLTRLANVLAGYVDGIDIPKPVSEVLGDELPKLMVVENVEVRIQLAAKLLRQHSVPVAEWDAWLEPLLDDGKALEFGRNGEVYVT